MKSSFISSLTLGLSTLDFNKSILFAKIVSTRSLPKHDLTSSDDKVKDSVAKEYHEDSNTDYIGSSSSRRHGSDI